jgi:hypoxanthine phosphoribosyltransferase
MVDTGETLRRLLATFQKGGQNQTLHILTVLTTQATDQSNRTREEKVGSQTYSVSYFLEVKQTQYPLGECPLCRLSLPFSREANDDTEPFMLTTYDMWSMAAEVGFKTEEDVPAYRKGLTSVPNYPEMIEKNGAWLASKIRARLRARPEGFPADAIIVCPDERGSRVLTEYLKLVLGVSVIRIPRNVINQFAGSSDSITQDIESYKAQRPAWYSELQASTRADIVVMDEFNASGKSLRGINKLLLALGKSVKCYFPLNDLNPNWSQQCGVPTYTLYQWQAIPKSEGFEGLK